MRATPTSMIILIVFLFAGCTTPAQWQRQASSQTAGACAGPALGLMADENLYVVGVVPNGPAAVAGVEIGDKLVDMTWVKMVERVNCNDSILMDENRSPLPTPSTELPPDFVEPAHPTDPVPFTNRQAVRDFLHSGVLFRLRVVRGEQEIELMIRPGVVLPHLGTPNPPTATPITGPFTYY